MQENLPRRRFGGLLITSILGLYCLFSVPGGRSRSQPSLGATSTPDAGVLASLGSIKEQQVEEVEGVDVPQYRVDPNWPRISHMLGSISGVQVEGDHVWIIHRGGGWGAPKDVPPVLVLDALSGEVVRGWGGPGSGFNWPESEHSLCLTHDGVWLQGGLPFIPGYVR
jgi:hypothetical protein